MSRAKPSHVAPRWQGPALLGAIALVLLAAFPYFEATRNANEIPRLLQAMSLVELDEWAIDGASRRGIPTGPDVARSPVDGRIYPNKPPGASVVGALAYRIARLGPEPPTLREFTWWARFLAGIVPTLIVAGLAWWRLRGAYGGAVSAAAISLWVFGTPIFSYARLVYGHALAACLLYGGVVLLDRELLAPREPKSPLRDTLRVGGAGLLAAAAITVEYGAAFAGIPIALALLWPVVAPGRGRAHRQAAARRALVGLAGALIPVAFLARYQKVVFGSAWQTGYHHAADPGFAELHGQGLLGLGLPTWENVGTHLLAPDTGLLVWSPLCVFGLVGLIRLSRRGSAQARATARLQLGIFLVILLMGLGLSFQGGWRVGPRYLVVVLPMLILGLAEYISAFRDLPRGGRAAAAMGALGVAAGASLLANGLAATYWPHIDPTNISEPFGAVLLPLWRQGYAPYGLPQLIPYGSTICLALSLLIGAGTLIWAATLGRPRIVLLPTLLGGALGLLLIALFVPLSVTAQPKSEANLDYIQRVYEPHRGSPEGPTLPGESRVLAPLERP